MLALLLMQLWAHAILQYGTAQQHRQDRKKPTCFLSFMTLNLSKSFNCLLFCIAARFLAQALSSNFCWTLCSSHFFATCPTPAARGSLGMTMGVSESLPRATS
jgi:hypothetical protein